MDHAAKINLDRALSLPESAGCAVPAGSRDVGDEMLGGVADLGLFWWMSRGVGLGRGAFIGIFCVYCRFLWMERR